MLDQPNSEQKSQKSKSKFLGCCIKPVNKGQQIQKPTCEKSEAKAPEQEKTQQDGLTPVQQLSRDSTFKSKQNDQNIRENIKVNSFLKEGGIQIKENQQREDILHSRRASIERSLREIEAIIGFDRKDEIKQQHSFTQQKHDPLNASLKKDPNNSTVFNEKLNQLDYLKDQEEQFQKYLPLQQSNLKSVGHQFKAQPSSEQLLQNGSKISFGAQYLMTKEQVNNSKIQNFNNGRESLSSSNKMKAKSDVIEENSNQTKKTQNLQNRESEDEEEQNEDFEEKVQSKPKQVHQTKFPQKNNEEDDSVLQQQKSQYGNISNRQYIFDPRVSGINTPQSLISPQSIKEAPIFANQIGPITQSRGHISYSIHSIKVQQSSNEDKNNNYVFYQMIKENESNESRSEKGDNNNLLQELKSNDVKVSTQSLASYSSSQNKFNFIGDQGYISPIMPKQNNHTEFNSNSSDDNEFNKQLALNSNQQYTSNSGMIPQQYVMNGCNSFNKQGSYRSSVEQQEILNEIRKNCGNSGQFQHQQLVVNHTQIGSPNVILNSSYQNNLEKKSSLQLQQQINKKAQSTMINNAQHASTMSTTVQDSNNQTVQCIPLQAVEQYYSQILSEKDNQLQKSYKKIASLSQKLGQIQLREKEKTEETRRIMRENLELRQNMNFLLQIKLKEQITTNSTVENKM